MSNVKAKVLLYPKRIQSFCANELNLFILKLSVIECLFLLSFQCHRIGRGEKELGSRHACRHKPTSVLLVSTMWYNGGESVGTTLMYWKNVWNWGTFSKGSSSWSCIWFGLMQWESWSNRRAMRSTFIYVGYDAVCRNRLVSTSSTSPCTFRLCYIFDLIHIGQALLLTRQRLVDMSKSGALSSFNQIFHFCKHLVGTR